MEMKDHSKEVALIQILTKFMEILLENIFYYALRLNWTLIPTAIFLFYNNYKSNYRLLWKQGGEKEKGNLVI